MILFSQKAYDKLIAMALVSETNFSTDGAQYKGKSFMFSM